MEISLKIKRGLFFIMKEVLEGINNLIWGPPLLILLVGTGIYLTIRLKLVNLSIKN